MGACLVLHSKRQFDGQEANYAAFRKMRLPHHGWETSFRLTIMRHLAALKFAKFLDSVPLFLPTWPCVALPFPS